MDLAGRDPDVPNPEALAVPAVSAAIVLTAAAAVLVAIGLAAAAAVLAAIGRAAAAAVLAAVGRAAAAAVLVAVGLAGGPEDLEVDAAEAEEAVAEAARDVPANPPPG